MESWIQGKAARNAALTIAEFWDDSLSQQQNLDQIGFWLRKNDALRQAMQAVETADHQTTCA